MELASAPQLHPAAGRTRTTWTVTPICDAGACSFRAKSSSGSTFRFRFDEAIGDYTAELTYHEDCVNYQTGEVVAKSAYETEAQLTLQGVRSVKTDEGETYATEMFGERLERSLLSPAGDTAGCKPGDATTDDMQVARIDPPAGETVTEAGVVGE